MNSGDVEMTEEWWVERLHDAGFRLTQPREIIIHIMNQTEKHLSAEDVYLKAVKMIPSIGLTTVYRTLDMLNQIGVVQKFDFGDKKARYELACEPHRKGHHHHLVCMRCKRIIDYTHFIDEEMELMQKTEKELSGKYHFHIMHHVIHFYGLCRECRKDLKKIKA